MQARYYDPVIGRFYSNDPIGAVEHLSTQNGIYGFNRYAYANNNPYKFTDPTGLMSELENKTEPPKLLKEQIKEAMKPSVTTGAVLLKGAENAVAIADEIADQIQSDTQDAGQVMETILENNPVTAIVDLIPMAGDAMESALQAPPNVDIMTDEELKKFTPDGRFRTKNVSRYLNRLKVIKAKPEN